MSKQNMSVFFIINLLQKSIRHFVFVLAFKTAYKKTSKLVYITKNI